MMRSLGILGLIVAAIHGVSRGAEPILGLPAPRDPARPGAVVLHGGGRVTEDVFERFVSLAGGKEARIVLVPSAGYRRADFSSEGAFRLVVHRRYSSWLGLPAKGKARSVEILATDDPDDADRAAFVRPLETATGVWFGGGEQSRLNYRFVGEFPRLTRFQKALRDVVARGGVVGGTSAGMAAMPAVMTLGEQHARAGGPSSIRAGHGLGVFDGAIVEQHFDGRGGRLERFTGLLRDSDRLDQLAGRPGAGDLMLGLAVEGSSAVVLRGDRLETLGLGHIHVFVKAPGGHALTWRTMQPGEAVRLKRESSGQVELVAGP